jgi:hypothetical protein
MMPWRRSLAGPRSSMATPLCPLDAAGVTRDGTRKHEIRVGCAGECPALPRREQAVPLRPASRTRSLADKIGERTVRCAEWNVDRYQRVVAVCYVGKEDLDGWLVKEGSAVAFRKYSLDYVPAEDEARTAKRGIGKASSRYRGNGGRRILDTALVTTEGSDGKPQPTISY